MSYRKEDYIRIKGEYAAKYRHAQELATERRLRLYGEIPAVRQLDAELAKTGMEIMKVIAEKGNVEESLLAIRRRNEDLQAQRRQLLQAHGYAENYTDVQYECDKCGDTGFVGTKMCTCMRRALVKAGYASSGLGALIQTQSFENFSLSYYQNGGQPERMQKDVARLRQFAENFDRQTYRNYLLIGGTGLGKTHLSTAVAKTVIERGFDVLYVTAIGAVKDFEARQFDRGSGMKNDPERYFEADLLIVDDLGTEVTNQFTLSCLYDLINTRINFHRCTFLNTNLSYRELEARYNERITSRLLGEYHPILFAGADIRKQKLQKNMK